MTRVGILVTGLLLATCTASALAAEPPEIFTKRCELCHSIAGKGGKKQEVGGPLDGVGKKRDEAWLRAYIADPKSQLPESKMPKLKLSPEEMDSVVHYLLTLK